MDRRAFLRGAAASLTALGLYGFKPATPATAADDEIECAKGALDPWPEPCRLELLYVGGPSDGDSAPAVGLGQIAVVPYVIMGETFMHQYHPVPELGILCWVGSFALEGTHESAWGPSPSNPWACSTGLWTPELAREAWESIYPPIQHEIDRRLMEGSLESARGAAFPGVTSQ